MQQVFVEPEQIANDIVAITGEDVKHLKNVLRMKAGETIRISASDGRNYFANIEELSDAQVTAVITKEAKNTELGNKIYLFQALPKGDRMETVIEKAVELGVYEIIPVEMKYCVVKLDEKKKKSKLKRYQTIAETAAKQSKRSIVPKVMPVMTYKEAVSYAKQCDICLVPYENKAGMAPTREILATMKPGDSVSIIVGPEGGFAKEEIEMVEEDMHLISLGNRILRTDTAAITSVGMVMLQSEYLDI